MNARSALLNAALDKVTGKADDYDGPENAFTEIAAAWSWWKGVTFTTKDVAMMMGLLKMSRLKHSPEHYDSVLDLAGYAACYADLLPQPTETMAPIFPAGQALRDAIHAENMRILDEELGVRKAGTPFVVPLTKDEEPKESCGCTAKGPCVGCL